ncbi:unnamed protein product, partial [Wuchereria bancrofti]
IEVRKCQYRYYGKKENIVCVCNATYCDDVPKVGNLKSLQAVIYKTNQRGKRFEYTVSSFRKKANGTGVIRLETDSQIRFQTIIGFGGAFTDAVGINIGSLSVLAQDNLLESYFGKTGNIH